MLFVVASTALFALVSARVAPPKTAAPYVGSTTTALYPPPNVTIDTALFPNESELGFEGPTPTGDEAFAIATAPTYPYNSDFRPLVQPPTRPSKSGNSKSFNPVRYWGNLAPWYSASFGLDTASPIVPDKCSLTQVHLVHRHGARYPTSDASPAQFAAKLHAAAANGSFHATGDLAFLNSWTYKLGGEVLTPFGRKQMFDLGVSFRSNYGALLKNFTESGTLPVFRSESQDRMVKSALNFAAGFFGIPFEDQYKQELIIETPGANNTFAPYDTCQNANAPVGNQGSVLQTKWATKYLAKTLTRLQSQLHGVNLTISDLTTMQMLCAYETVALGFSSFCPIFTEEEFRGFEHFFNIGFWYNNAFGSPVAAAQGAGYASELLARLKNVLPDVAKNPFTVNATLDGNNATFPLGQSIYVDATHEVVVLNIITALNFTSLTRSGAPPLDHIPSHPSFETSATAPFGTNLAAQVLDCADRGPSIRFFLNDGALPIGIKGCPKDKDGLCPLKIFIPGLQERLDSIDWTHDCLGTYNATTGIIDGRAPKK